MAIADILGVKLDDIPKLQQANIVAALTEIVLSRLTEELYLKLSSKDQETLESLSEKDDSQDQIFNFLKERFPDIEERAKKIADEEKLQLETRVRAIADLIKNNKVQ